MPHDSSVFLFGFALLVAGGVSSSCASAPDSKNPIVTSGTGGGGPIGIAGTSGSISQGGNSAAGASAGSANAGMSGGGVAGNVGGVGNAGSAGNAPSGPCGAPGLLLCDDFEAGVIGGLPDSAKWSKEVNGGGTIAVDGSTPAHSGTKSVHVNGTTGYATYFAAKGAPVFPLASGKLYVRTFIRLAAAMSAGHNTYFEIGLENTPDAPHETRVGVHQSQLELNQPSGDRELLSNENYYTDNEPGVVLAPGTWHCLELLVDHPASTVDVWVDDAEVPDLHVSDWQSEAFDVVRIGAEAYNGGTEQWFDDVALGTARIGCH